MHGSCGSEYGDVRKSYYVHNSPQLSSDQISRLVRSWCRDTILSYDAKSFCSDDLDISPDPLNNYTEAELEKMLLMKLTSIYLQALFGIVIYGFDFSVALKAILENGGAVGENGSAVGVRDIIKIILMNSAPGMIDISVQPGNEDYEAFKDLGQLMRSLLEKMLLSIQQARNSGKREALWCLFKSNFDLDAASRISITNFSSNAGESKLTDEFKAGKMCGDSTYHESFDIFSNDMLDKVCEQLNKCYLHRISLSNLAPVLRYYLKERTKHLVDSFCALLKVPNALSIAPSDPFSSDNPLKQQDSGNLKLPRALLKSSEFAKGDAKSLNMVLSQMNPKILRLANQIHYLETQVNEHVGWANKKVLQADEKLGLALSEIDRFRSERLGNQQLKHGNLMPKEETMDRLAEMISTLKFANSRFDAVNTVVKYFEMEDLEIQSEIKAFNLHELESNRKCLASESRYKKCHKSIFKSRKQITKYQEEIEVEKLKFSRLQQRFQHLRDAQVETQDKLRQEMMAKEEAILLAQEELKLKKEAEIRVKSKMVDLQDMLETQRKQFDNDVKRLEQQISRLEMYL
ncbi:hypothetical protein RJ641_016536 [Dillenia turbinata]|uniref:Uncharacterized protein n=1 Tax=Dillenia turbinata TaxID=194707 RepID=A0AAN8UPP4_9MAGN